MNKLMQVVYIIAVSKIGLKRYLDIMLDGDRWDSDIMGWEIIKPLLNYNLLYSEIRDKLSEILYYHEEN